MSPTGGFDVMANGVEARLSMLEQRSSTVTAFGIDVQPDPVTGVPVVHDSLAWVSGWESYSVLGGFVVDPDYPDTYTGGVFSTPYAPAQAYRVGNTCFLSGLVRRRTSTLALGVRHNLPMFTLPVGWRPVANVPLLCTMGSSAPDGSLATVDTAWVEVRPDTTQVAGRVYFVAGSAAMTVNTSWISLQGSFPSTITDPAT